MNIKSTLAQLREECLRKGITMLEGYKYPRKWYVEQLQGWGRNHPETWLVDHVQNPSGKMSWGLEQMCKIESPMLCYTWDKLKPTEQLVCDTSEDWIAQEKIDGVRCIVTYYPFEGIRIFTRAINPVDHFPVELTSKLTIDGQECMDWHRVRDYEEYKAKNEPPDFILDCELVMEGDIDLTEYMAVVDRENNMNVLMNPTSIVVHCDAETVRKCPVKFKLVVLDVLQIGMIDYKPMKLWERLGKLRELMECIKGDTFSMVGDNISFGLSSEEYYNRIIANGGEGVVYKHIYQPYFASETRKRDACVKRKPMREGTEVDAFISGTIHDKTGKIVSLKLAVCDPYGERLVGMIHYFTEDERAILFNRHGDGSEDLKEGLLGKVVRFTGSDFDAMHGTYRRIKIDWKSDIRDDKVPMNCDGSELDDLF